MANTYREYLSRKKYSEYAKKKDLEQQISFDTYASDLQALSDSLAEGGNAFGSIEGFDGARNGVNAMLERTKALQKYTKLYGGDATGLAETSDWLTGQQSWFGNFTDFADYQGQKAEYERLSKDYDFEATEKRLAELREKRKGINSWEAAADHLLGWHEFSDGVNDYQLRNDLDEEIAGLEKEIGLARKYQVEQLEILPSFKYNSVPKSTNTQGLYYRMDAGKEGYDEVDWMYEYINGYSKDNPTEATENIFGDWARAENLSYMTEEEKARYNYLHLVMGRDAATQYLHGLDDTLYARQMGIVSEFAGEHPVLGTLGAIGGDVLSAFEVLNTEDGQTVAMADAGQAFRSGVTQSIESDIGKFLYNTGVSALESFAVGALFGNAGGVVLGLSSMASTYNDLLRRGADPDTAMAAGLAAGIFECLFETISLGQLKVLKEVPVNSFKDLVLNIAKSAGVNATEEAATEAANILYDTIANGEFSEAQRMMDEGMSKDEIRNAFLAQIGEAAASGAVMGMGFAGVGGGIAGAGNAASAAGIGKAVKGGESSFGTLSGLAEMGEKYGIKQTAKVKVKGDKVSNRAVGDLYRRVSAAVARENQGTTKKAITERLAELGTDKKKAKKLADIVLKKYIGESLSFRESVALDQSKMARQALGEMTENANSKWVNELRATLMGEASRDISDIDDATLNSAVEQAAQIAQGEENDVTEAESGASLGEMPQIASLGLNGVMLAAPSGEVALDDTAMPEDKALLYTLAGLMPSAELANAFVQAWDGNTDPTAYFKAYQMIYTYGRHHTGYTDAQITEAGKRSGLGEAQIASAFKSGVKSLAEERRMERERLDGIIAKFRENGANRPEGKWDAAGLRGVDLKQVAKENLGLQDIEQFVAFLRMTTKAFGWNVRVIADNSDKRSNGGYDPATNTLTFNIYAGTKTGTEIVRSAMPNTISHETVHWMKRNAPEQYQALEDMVLAALKNANDYDFGEAVLKEYGKYKEKHGQDIDDATAREEIVARACEDLFGRSEAIRQFLADFAEKNKEAATGFTAAVKKVLAKIKEFFDNLMFGHGSRTLEAGIVRKCGADVVQGLQEQYDKTFMAALEGNAARNALGEFEQGGERFSFDSDDVKKQVESGLEVPSAEVVSFVRSVLSMKDLKQRSRRKKKLGKISEHHAAILKRETGIDVTGYEIWLNGDSVVHINRRHGANGQHDHTMADINDYGEIARVANNATHGQLLRYPDGNIVVDDVYQNSDQTPAVLVLLEMQQDDGTFFVAECVPDNVDKRLYVRSAYKSKKGGKDQQLNMVQKTPQHTPEAFADSNATTNSIPQNDEKSTPSAQENSGNSGNGTTGLKSDPEDDIVRTDYQGLSDADFHTNGLVYSYDFLVSQKDMQSTDLPELPDIRNANQKIDKAKVVSMGLANAASVGYTQDGKIYVKNAYTGRSYRVDAQSIRHGLNGEQNRLLTNSRLGAVIGDVVKNSIPINGLKNTSSTAVGTYALAGYSIDSKGREFVSIVTVEQYSGDVTGVAVYDVTHSLSGRQKNNRDNRFGTKPQGINPNTNTSVTISITDFLQIVNSTHQSILSDDVLNHLGETRNPGGYYSNRVLFSDPEDDVKSDREILAGALLNHGWSEKERNALELYQGKSKELTELKTRRQEIYRELSEKQFRYGGEDEAAQARYKELTKELEGVKRRIEKKNHELYTLERGGDTKRLVYMRGKLSSALAEKQRVINNTASKDEQLEKQLAEIEERIAHYSNEVQLLETGVFLQSVLYHEKRRAIRQWKDAAERKVDALHERHMTQIYTERVVKKAKELRAMLLENSEQKHIPDALKKPIANLLSLLDFSAIQTMRKGELTHKNEDLQAAFEEVKDLLLSLGDEESDVYGGLDLPEETLDDFKQLVKEIHQMAGKAGENGTMLLREMNSKQLQTLNKSLYSITRAVRQANDLFANERFRHVSEIALDFIGNSEQYAAREQRSKISDFLSWENMVPYYAFKRLGAAGEALFKGFMQGQNKFAFLVKEIIDFTDKLYTEDEVKEWSRQVHTFDGTNGKVYITTAQIMSLYELWKDKDARQHILGGGGRIQDIDLGIKKKYANDPNGTALGELVVDAMFAKLTPRQKAVADSLQRFMAEECAKWGNEISYKRWGIRIFGLDYYFPIESDRNTVKADVEQKAKENGLFSLLHKSFTKKRVFNANNRIMVRSVFDVFSAHTTDMAKYSAFALPLLDMQKFINFKEIVTKEQVAKEAYQAAVEDWNGEDKGGYFALGDTSDALAKIGVPKNKIYFDQSKAKKSMEDHPEVTKGVLKGIPELLQNPIVVAESYDNTVLIYGELYDDAGHPVMVALRMDCNSRANDGTTVNKIRSVGVRMRSMDKYLADQNILYLDEDKKRTDTWFQALGRSTPFGGTKYGPIRSIPHSGQNVNTVSNAGVGISTDEQKDTSFTTKEVRASMEKAFGTAAYKYIEQFLIDLNGNIGGRSAAESILQKGITGHKIAAVGANLRVALLQPTAYVRLLNVMEPKYFFGGLKAMGHLPSCIKKMQEHAGIALWKSLGYRDTNIAAPIQTKIKHDETWRDKVVEKSMILAELGDKVTWGAIWYACELETRDKRKDLKIGSEEYYRAVADRFTEAIYATQVVDSTFTKSQIMRKKDFFATLFTSFMSEPTLSYNLLAANALSLMDAKRRGDKITKAAAKPFVRAVGVFAIGALIQAAVESLIDAARGANDDEEYGERYFEEFLANAVQEIVPLNLIPVVKDIWSIALATIKGDYMQSSRMDLEVYNRLAKAVKATAKMFEDGEVSYSAIYKILSALSSLTGLPISNLVRDVIAIWNVVVGDIAGGTIIN